jgi:transposase
MAPVMIAITPQMRILVAVEPVDFRYGIDGLARVCREALSGDPFSGAVFIFRNRRGTGLRALVYDGQGFWLCYKRLSAGRFRWWPKASEPTASLEAHELAVLLRAGDPTATRAAPVWRKVAMVAGG